MNQNGQIRYTCVSSFPYSPFASRSLAVSQPNLIPHWQHIPRFGAVVAGPSRSSLPDRLSGTDSSSGPIPHWQRFPRFSAVVAGPSRSSPSGRRLWYGFLIRSISTLAAYPAIQCRCGRSVSQQPFRQASLVRIPRPVPFHTGSVSRDSVPLWQVRLAAAFLIGFLVRIPRPVHFHTGSVSRDSVLLWKKRHGKNLKELFRKI